jgi:hypothetical protein
MRSLAFLLAYCLAGCASSSVEPPSTGPTDSNTATQPAEVPNLASIAPQNTSNAGPTALLGTSCSWEGAGQYFAGRNPEWPRPPGWQDSNSLVWVWRLEIFVCDRLSFGPLERGPVTLGVESVDRYKPPEECEARVSDEGYSELVTTMFANDSEIADALTKALQIEVFYVDLQHNREQSASGVRSAWEGQVAGKPFALNLEMMWAQHSVDFVSNPNMYIKTENGFVALPFSIAGKTRLNQLATATGELNEPFVYPRHGTERVAGTSEFFDEVDFVAPIVDLTGEACS